MSLKGTFASYYASSLLKLFNLEKKSGELVVKKGRNETTVYLAEGNVVYATSTQKELRLGAFLINQEIITPEQHEMCIEISKARKSPLGKILLEKGYLTSVELKQIIGEQIEQIIFSLLLWEKADFEFKESDTPHKGVDIAPINILNLIEDASQRIADMTVLLKQIPNDMIIFKMADDVSDAGEIKLNANEWRVLALVNGQRTVRQLVAESGYEEFEVYKILSSLLATGHIQEQSKKPDSKRKEVDSEKTDMQLEATHIEVDTEIADEEEIKEEPPPLENKLTAQKKTEDIKPVVTDESEKPKEEEWDADTETGSEIIEDDKLESQPETRSAGIAVSESELSEMVTVYIDILKPIHKILESELGMEAFSIIDDSKRQLNSNQKRILKNFRAENPSASNIHEIIEAIKESPDEEDNFQLIIISFNTLIQKVLLRVPDILGVQPTRKMLQEIERVIYHIDNEQSEIIKKTTIIGGIKDILLETERVLSKQ
jgi:hypothetical protein